jgi:hypothetical protein
VADTPIRACRYFQTAQSDVCRPVKRNVGAVQSKATVRAAGGGNRTRLGSEHTPRSKLFPSNSIIKSQLLGGAAFGV